MGLEHVRDDFPLLAREVAGRPVAYLDNAATSLKPRPVVEAMNDHYFRTCANIHRGKHLLSEEASIAFEEARATAARFLGSEVHEVVFVAGATAGINLVADGLRLAPGENVVASVLDHHANLLPWSARAELRMAPLGEDGLPDLAAAEALIDARTRIVAVTQCSNVTGAIVPVDRWAAMARAHGVPLLVDAAQGAAHGATDVRALGCDFLVLSGHKCCGPTGTGVLYGRAERLEALQPRSLGGGTVSEVTAEGDYTLRQVPWRLEAGTPNIAGVIGMGEAFRYLVALGMDAIEARNHALREALVREVRALRRLKVYHPPLESPAAPIVALNVDGGAPGTPDLVSRMLSDSFGIMTRSGHHCCHPLHARLGADGSVRVSLQFYNTLEEVRRLGEAMAVVAQVF